MNFKIQNAQNINTIFRHVLKREREREREKIKSINIKRPLFKGDWDGSSSRCSAALYWPAVYNFDMNECYEGFSVIFVNLPISRRIT